MLSQSRLTVVIHAIALVVVVKLQRAHAVAQMGSTVSYVAGHVRIAVAVVNMCQKPFVMGVDMDVICTFARVHVDNELMLDCEIG